jgi:hypothetical protein
MEVDPKHVEVTPEPGHVEPDTVVVAVHHVEQRVSEPVVSDGERYVAARPVVAEDANANGIFPPVLWGKVFSRRVAVESHPAEFVVEPRVPVLAAVRIVSEFGHGPNPSVTPSV